MAKLNTRATSTDLEPLDTSSSSVERHREPSDTPASDLNSGSDKENPSTSGSKIQPRKRRSEQAPMSEHSESASHASKRRRIQPQNARAAALQRELDARGEKEYYDPDQDEDEKRATKKTLRELLARVNDSRSEYLQPDSTGIEETIKEADEVFKNVKQTHVATIDSRLLVTVGDLAYKKVNTLTLGDTSTGIDVDDFVGKCISFMSRANDNGQDHAATQLPSQQRRRRQRAENEDEEDEPLNWDHLGRNACFLYNARPCVSGFLLGPLSVQKKVRQQTQRRPREAQADNSHALRPIALGAEDLEKQESANLTVICAEIHRLLDTTITKGQVKVDEEYDEDFDEAQTRSLMAKHNITDNGCVPLFNFCFNPKSFGQTVENVFYVSFLIKEGKVGLDFDTQGLPTLGTAEERRMEERQDSQRNQAVFSLDFDIWKDVVESFGIEKSIIPHREEEKWNDGLLHATSEAVTSNDDDDDDG